MLHEVLAEAAAVVAVVVEVEGVAEEEVDYGAEEERQDEVEDHLEDEGDLSLTVQDLLSRSPSTLYSFETNICSS